jgi:hypothetical protein
MDTGSDGGRRLRRAGEILPTHGDHIPFVTPGVNDNSGSATAGSIEIFNYIMC